MSLSTEVRNRPGHPMVAAIRGANSRTASFLGPPSDHLRLEKRLGKNHRDLRATPSRMCRSSAVSDMGGLTRDRLTCCGSIGFHLARLPGLSLSHGTFVSHLLHSLLALNRRKGDTREHGQLVGRLAVTGRGLLFCRCGSGWTLRKPTPCHDAIRRTQPAVPRKGELCAFSSIRYGL